MIDWEASEHHPAITAITDTLCQKTQNKDRAFFHVEAAYFLCKMAASMRATLDTADRGQIPVNVYAAALATSGYGKGHSVNIMETVFLKGIADRFKQDTFPVIAETVLTDEAIRNAAASGESEEAELAKLQSEFKLAGEVPFTFDSGTPAAVKQTRHKLMMAEIGALNCQVDEIGSNLTGSVDLLNLYLELYDQGLVKQKLTKNTAENIRGKDLDRKTPTNLLMFGTASKLFDGGPAEDAFMSFLETGYARRCLFAWGVLKRSEDTRTAEEVYRALTDKTSSAQAAQWRDHFTNLADPSKHRWIVTVPDDVAIELLRYKMHCEKLADALPDNQEIQKAELAHRYFKALKLAGAYAFVDESSIMDIDQLTQAVKLVEESGKSFLAMIQREKTYVRLAKYITETPGEFTHADLHEALPYYKTGTSARSEMMSLATAWSYGQHRIIKKRFADGIEFFSGECLAETDLEELCVSYSTHFAEGYCPDRVSFEALPELFTYPDLNFCNHHFRDDHRLGTNVIPGFNLVVIDIDNGANLDVVHDLLSDYAFATYTTKRHTDDAHRFRLVMPITHELKLDRPDFKEFMRNLCDWLPVEVDTASFEIEKKWLCNEHGAVHLNHGALLDPFPFIPKTSKNEQFKSEMVKVQDLSNLERWFAERMAGVGSRNNHMLRFAMALADSGDRFKDIETKVLEFNNKLPSPLPEDEIQNTILVSVSKKCAAR
jgi:hypothetical protein